MPTLVRFSTRRSANRIVTAVGRPDGAAPGRMGFRMSHTAGARPAAGSRHRLQPPVPGSGLPYRPALDGVRVVAVVLVVAFHAGMASVASGFVGVDVFFVLSGFLITRLLLCAAHGGGVRFVEFYARRMRRLLPAALLVLAVTSLGWVAVASAVEREPVLGDARAAALYFANWHFAHQSVDYFASGDAPSPFEHYWSLSVEEQFYAVWPAVVALVFLLYRRDRRRAQRRLALVTVLLLAGSVALLVAAMRREDVAYGYFGTHTRAYQLLAGALLAMCLGNREEPVAARAGRAAAGLGQLLALAGVVLVAGSVPDLSVPVRGMVTVGLTVLLLGTLELHPGAPAARVLSLPTIAYFGQISYGVYLWHWPVILAVRRFAVMSPHSLFVVAMVLSFGLAALSFRVLEQPVRRSPGLARHGRPVIAIGLACSAVAALLVFPALLSADRDPAVVPLAVTSNDTPTGGGGGTTVPNHGVLPTDALPKTAARTPVPGRDAIRAAGQPPAGQLCVEKHLVHNGCLTHRGSGPTVLVVGDSHLQMLFGVLDAIAGRHDIQLYTWMYYVCPWQADVLPTGANSDSCKRGKGFLRQMLEQVRPDVVVTINRGYDDPNYPRGLYREAAPSVTDPGRVLSAATGAAVDEIRSYGARLIVVEPVPSLKVNQRDCLSRATYVEQCAGTAAGKLASEKALEARAASRHDVTVVDLDRVLCPRLPTCAAVVNGLVVRKDLDHMSVPFAQAITDVLDSRLTTAGAFTG
jgi:peptidoglycan/LPS O-acetylase OafA/YrhL